MNSASKSLYVLRPRFGDNIEVFKDCKEYVSGVVDEHCDLPGHLSLPKPVQELMDAEGDEPPLNLAAGAARTDCLCRDGRSLEDSPSVEIYGHEYTIDNAADFSNILQPSFITGNDIELGNECYVYTDLTSAKPSRSTGIDYSVYSRPIDLSKGPMNRRPSQRGDIGLASLTAPPGLPHRVYPVPLTLQFSGGRGGQPAKCSRKAPKRLRDGDDQQSQTKKPGKPNTNKTSTGSNGRHLWEFIRELLQASDSGDKLAGEIIRWENRAEGIFRIIDSKQVAQLWGARKRNKTMTYEKLSRALRWSRTYGFLSAVPKDGTYPKKLCFRFGDLANWRD